MTTAQNKIWSLNTTALRTLWTATRTRLGLTVAQARGAVVCGAENDPASQVAYLVDCARQAHLEATQRRTGKREWQVDGLGDRRFEHVYTADFDGFETWLSGAIEKAVAQ